MKRKALSIFMMLLLVLSLVPATALSAAEIDSAELIDEENEALPAPEDWVSEEETLSPELSGAGKITSARLYVAEPAVGASPDYNVHVSRAYDNPFTITGVEWEKWIPKSFFSINGDKFEEGMDYRLSVTLTPDPGYSFSDSCSYKLNDSLTMSQIGQSGSSVTVAYTFAVIKNLPLTITPPTAGAHPDNILISSADGWIQEVCTWFPDGGKIPVKSSDTFMAGEVYTLSVILRPWAGYRFADNCKVSLNGKTKFYSGDPYIEPDSIAFSINFECLNVPFVDVDFEAYYASPVVWAYTYKPQITAGTDATHFSPNAPCTRGQVVTFLWRAFGCPEPKNTKNAFVDVKKDAYYYKAILWAVEKGITNGTDPTHFSPNAPCTRGQVVTFLWRAKGEPSTSNIYIPFVDVPSKAFYYRPVCWAYVSNVTGGTDATHFSPNATCTRGQVVTFLFRALSNG